jgi:general secretion pathway protein F
VSAALSSFHFRAARQDGSVETGHIDASSRQAAIEQLAQRGLFPIRVVEGITFRPRRRAIPSIELAVGLRILADLLESGLPMSRAIIALEAMASPAWRDALPSIQTAIREGKSFARALEEAPITVPAVVRGIIFAGERGAGLAAAVRSAADLTQQMAETRAAIRSALAYPALLASAGFASAAVLIVIVLPKFAAILSDMGQALPASTRFVLGASTVLRAAAWPTLATVILLLLAGRAYLTTPSGRTAWHGWLLSLPMIGDTRAAVATSRLCTTLSALLDAGVPISGALPHAGQATGDMAIQERLASARTLVVQGQRLSSALSSQRVITAVAGRLIHAGEESGRLASLLSHAGRIERDRATRRVQAAVRVIEPALIVGFGGIVALVAASLLQALYSVRPGT